VQALILGGSPRIDGRLVTTLHQDVALGSALTIAMADRVCIIQVI